MCNFKGTKDWRIREHNDFFFIEADLPNAEENGHYPRLEVMQEDFGEHNGYTKELRMEDAKLIIDAFNVRQQINFDLPELLKQRNEMLRFLQILDLKGGLGIDIHEKINKLMNQSEQ